MGTLNVLLVSDFFFLSTQPPSDQHKANGMGIKDQVWEKKVLQVQLVSLVPHQRAVEFFSYEYSIYLLRSSAVCHFGVLSAPVALNDWRHGWLLANGAEGAADAIEQYWQCTVVIFDMFY